jgi:hypothetical protein
MYKFKTICKRLGVPIADEKTEGYVTSMNYCGLTINNESMCAKIQEETIKELFKKLNECEFKKKKTLNQLQSLCGSLAFCTRTLSAGRASNSRLYLATAKAKKPLHLIKVTTQAHLFLQ